MEMEIKLSIQSLPQLPYLRNIYGLKQNGKKMLFYLEYHPTLTTDGSISKSQRFSWTGLSYDNCVTTFLRIF